ncbi:MAG: hypothetical protein QM579_10775, partial [Desulfovibrio sp.]|uniref:tRNA1(Val) (adenine(37)-N6)-methyltransferase n=1 Tax=Desulfovibrio sp. TaxID=885 RepID=UPI0039E725E4
MQNSLPQHIIKARSHFPRGLEQPEGSLRFGADALLLAAFAARYLPPEKRHPGAANGNPFVVAELGCGCGAALLGLAMRCPQVSGLGLEREKPLVQAAVNNAALLGLSDQLHFASLDLADGAALSALRIPVQLSATMEPRAASLSRHKAGMEQQDLVQPASSRLDMVMANPPYDRKGRPSAKNMREHALRGVCAAHGHKTALDTFCRAAATLLRHQGRFFCIYDAPALPRLCVALNAVRLGVRRILPVQARKGEPALRVLVEARKNAAHDTVLETPLVLHDTPDPPDRSGTPHTLGAQGAPGMSDARRRAGPGWSAEALTFCSWLGPAPSSV